MDLEIIKEKEMPLLSRKRVTVNALFQKEKTPSKEDVRKSLAKKLKVDENLVAIRHIYQKFGDNAAKIIAHVYNSLEDLKNVEEIKKKPKAKKEKAAKKEGGESGKEKSKE